MLVLVKPKLDTKIYSALILIKLFSLIMHVQVHLKNSFFEKFEYGGKKKSCNL